MTDRFKEWFLETMRDADGNYNHLPDWLEEDMRRAWDAALSVPALGTVGAVKVKPLDESKTQGWRDDNGRFCLPLSDGYYIKFPPDDTQTGLFMAWFLDIPVGGHAELPAARKLAQDHHKDRILSALSSTPVGEMDGWQPTHKHVKRGSLYRLDGYGEVQTDTPLTDYAKVAIYRAQDGTTWVRPVSEFEDGRFTALASEGCGR